MDMGRLNPLNDHLFLKLMGEEGNEIQCLAFLNAVLGAKSNRTKGSQPIKRGFPAGYGKEKYGDCNEFVGRRFRF